MKRFPTMLAGCAVAAVALVTPAAAENVTAVNVALMDISAVASGPVGQGFGMMGSGAGFGMMSPGMMGRGGGQGMMGMMSIRADRTSGKAGPVTFQVTNWSRSVVHEMLVVAVDSPDAPLPYDFSKQIIPEDQVKVLVETSELQPNASKSIELTLEPGNYLLVCNVPGHYAAGMVLAFNVAP